MKWVLVAVAPLRRPRAVHWRDGGRQPIGCRPSGHTRHAKSSHAARCAGRWRRAVEGVLAGATELGNGKPTAGLAAKRSERCPAGATVATTADPGKSS